MHARSESAFALAYGVIVIFVVVMIVVGFTQFRSFVTHTTELAAQEVNATAAAEAGLVAIKAELQANALFRTHQKAVLVNADQVRANPLVTPQIKFEQEVAADAWKPVLAEKLSGFQGVAQAQNQPGVYWYSVGRGMGPAIGRGFEGSFRVKVAPIAIPNYPKLLLAVESRGRFDQRAVSIVEFLEGGGGQTGQTGGTPLDVAFRFPVVSSALNEFMIADGDVVDVGMGSPQDDRNHNVYSFGSFYGHNHIQVGNIADSGTRQVFSRFGGFQCGGDIWFADSYRVTFWDPTNLTTEEAGQVQVNGTASRPDPNASTDYYTPSQGKIVDFRHNGRLSLPNIVQSMDNTLADSRVQNKYDLAKLNDQGDSDESNAFEGKSYVKVHPDYKNPYGQAGAAVEIYFGRPSYLAGVSSDNDPVPYLDNPSEAGLASDHPGRMAKPANLLYCRGKNVVVWGCPDRDIAIYCDKDIYVAGDFNQNPWHHQIYTSQEDPQLANRDGRDARYIDPVRFAIDPQLEGGDLNSREISREGSSVASTRLDQTSNANLQQERKLVRLIAKGRVWLDYRRPSRVVANEMIPWLEYQLAAHLLGPAGASAPGASQKTAALAAITYATDADFSRKEKAEQINLSGALTPLTSGTATAPTATPMGDDYIQKVLCFPAGSAGYQAAVTVLATDLSSPQASQIHPAATKLFYKVLCPHEKTDLGAGLWLAVQKYYDEVYENSPNSDNLNQHKGIFRQNARMLRLYVPEMTVNAVMTDGAKRKGLWENDPHSNSKIFNELGNANRSSDGYVPWLRFASGTACPGIGRVYGNLANLRQNDPDPDLTTGGGVYLPLKRKRIFPRNQAKWLGLSFRFGNGGDAGLKNTFRVVSRRENVLAGERGSAEASFTNWQ